MKMRARSKRLKLCQRTGFPAVFTLLCILAFSVAPVAWGAAPDPGRPVTLKDFVHARELETKLEGALCRFPIDAEIYEGLIQSQNRDLAVFNSGGELVPFVVLPMSPVYDTSASRSDLAVPFFELPPEGGPQSGSEKPAPVDVYVRTGADGQVVEIKGSPTRGDSLDRRYLLDFSSVPVNENADSNRLELIVPEDMKLNAEVDVYQSENLRDWRPVLRKAPLIQLQNREARLDRNGIDLPRAPQRYLLLRIGGVGVNSDFALKDARYSFTLRSSLVRDEVRMFEGTPTADRRAVEFDMKGAFPVSKINFVLQEPGLHKVRYFSRSGPNAPWRPAGSMELSMIRESPSSARTNASVPVGSA